MSINRFRTTYKSGEQQIVLAFSSVDLRNFMRSGFSQIIGVFENHTVAHGQDTEAWVRKSSENVRREAQHLLEEYRSEMSKSLEEYLDELVIFLQENQTNPLDIRHHYAWWYPKLLDQLLA